MRTFHNPRCLALATMLLISLIVLCSSCGASGSSSHNTSACLLLQTGTIRHLSTARITIQEMQGATIQAMYSNNTDVLLEKTTIQSTMQSFVGKKVQIILTQHPDSSFTVRQVIAASPAAVASYNKAIPKGYAFCPGQGTTQSSIGKSVTGSLTSITSNALTINDQHGGTNTISMDTMTQFLLGDTGSWADVREGASIQFVGLRDQHGAITLFVVNVLA